LEEGQTIPDILFSGIRELISEKIPKQNEKYKFLLKYINHLKDEKYDIAVSGLSDEDTASI